MVIKIFFWIILALLLGTAVYLFYNNVYLPNDPSSYKAAVITSNESTDITNSSGGIQFYSDMRFNHLPITYSVDSVLCTQKKQDDADSAVKIIEDSSSDIKFLKIAGADADMIIKCSDGETEKGAGMFVAGEGGPTVVRPTGEFNVIEKGSVLLIRDSDCKTPNVAIHEILHVLGFDHSPDKNSIMYNITECNQKITQPIIDKINELYSIPPLPDLYISTINATKKNIYLDFEVEIRNKGLVDSGDVSLVVRANNKDISTFPIDKIDFGAGKILKVSNVRIPSSADNFEFVIDPENQINELNKSNNNLILEIK